MAIEAYNISGHWIVDDPDCDCDPATKLFRAYLARIFDRKLTTWGIEEAFSKLEGSQFIADIIEICIEQIDIAEIFRTGMRDISLNPVSGFPFCKVPILELENVLKIAWETELAERYPNIRNAKCPGSFISEYGLLDGDCSVSRKIDSGCATGMWLNPRDVIENSIKWILQSIPRNENNINKCHPKKFLRAQVSMRDTVDPSKLFTSMMISKLLKVTGYNICTATYVVAESPVDESTIIVAIGSVEYGKSNKISTTFDLKTKWYEGMNTVVIPYTYARIKSILESYESLVMKGEYPRLQSINLIDFSTISKCKEEVSLVMMVFYWPRIYRYIINVKFRTENQIHLPFLLQFMTTFGKLFETFYTTVKVIVPRTAGHSFKMMMARLYLLKAMRIIFEEFIDIFPCESLKPDSFGL